MAGWAERWRSVLTVVATVVVIASASLNPPENTPFLRQCRSGNLSKSSPLVHPNVYESDVILYARSYDEDGRLHRYSDVSRGNRTAGDRSQSTGCGHSVRTACSTIHQALRESGMQPNKHTVIKLIVYNNTGCEVRSGHESRLHFLSIPGFAVSISILFDPSNGCTHATIHIDNETAYFLQFSTDSLSKWKKMSLFIENVYIHDNGRAMTDFLSLYSQQPNSNRKLQLTFVKCNFKLQNFLFVSGISSKTQVTVLLSSCHFVLNGNSFYAMALIDFNSTTNKVKVLGTPYTSVTVRIEHSTFRSQADSHTGAFVLSANTSFFQLHATIHNSTFRGFSAPRSVLELRGSYRAASRLVLSHCTFENSSYGESFLNTAFLQTCVDGSSLRFNNGLNINTAGFIIEHRMTLVNRLIGIFDSRFEYNERPDARFATGADVVVRPFLSKLANRSFLIIDSAVFLHSRYAGQPFLQLFWSKAYLRNNSFLQHNCGVVDIALASSTITIDGAHRSPCAWNCNDRFNLDKSQVVITQLHHLLVNVIPVQYSIFDSGVSVHGGTRDQVVIGLPFGVIVADIFQRYGACTLEDDGRHHGDITEYSHRPQKDTFASPRVCSIQVDMALQFTCVGPTLEGEKIFSTPTDCDMYGLKTLVACSAEPFNITRNLLCADDHSKALIVKERNQLAVLSKGLPTWILFQESSTECLKRLDGDTWLYARTKCNRMAITSKVLEFRKQTLRLLPRDYALNRLADVIRAYNDSISNVLLGHEHWYLPWVHAIGVGWNEGGRDIQRLRYTARQGPSQTSISQLTLYPSPGEVITLNIDTRDSLLNTLSNSLSLTVKSDNASVRMIQSDGWQPAAITSMEFLSKHELTGFALAGQPGSSGSLLVTLKGANSARARYSAEPFVLEIPFRLRPCHKGFSDPFPQLTRTGNLWVCQSQKDVVPGVKSCDKGRFLQVRAGYWAGNARNASWDGVGSFPQSIICKANGTGSFETTSAYAKYVDYPFAIAQCQNPQCLNRDWDYGETRPCPGHSAGPLCDRCEPGYWQTPSLPHCYHCSASTTRIPLHVYIVAVVFMTFLSFPLLVMQFNFGMSPILDCWLFLIQASGRVFVHKQQLIYVTVRVVLTWGLGIICPEQPLDTLDMNSLLLLQPGTFLVWFIVVRVLRSYNTTGQIIQRWQQHMLLVRVMWFILVYSYFVLAFVCINALWCTRLNDQFVLAADGSIPCYQGKHWVHAVLSVAIMLLVILPAPIILAVPQCQRSIHLKGFIDEASRHFKPNRRWWASINLLRRVAVALISTVNSGSEMNRMLLLNMFCWTYVVCYALVRPLKKSHLMGISANNWECMFLFSLAMISTLQMMALGQGELRETLNTASLVLYIAINVVAISACVLKQCCSSEGGYGRIRNFSIRMWYTQRQQTRATRLDSTAQSDVPLTEVVLNNMASGIRDPLLVDQIREEQESLHPKHTCIIC
eukprot:scpid17663/ scgid10447/ 